MSRIERARAFRARVNIAMAAAAQAGTVDAGVIATAAEEATGGKCLQGELRRGSDGGVYRCTETMEAATKPTQDKKRWVRVDAQESVNGTAYAAWVQPASKKGGYKKGAVVAYEGDVYESTENGNCWKPDSGAGWIVKEKGGETV